ncbi:FliA/WhiG family RNA polymerase sigma factor [uncultured Desulfuromonas sp.]|uniref:FliA/WhiG family RNA polymerase sigma factor n=1 Tax=uncultured Desulfuromonas sp. TaxID=181013 RepID=UPI002AAB8690|nr:FliA/WhiG family RNA polymerase sigma factor [uncultured Desulfuromonas sp.]
MSSPYGYGPSSGQDKNELVKSHMPLVHLVVDRMRAQVPGFVTKDDMTSAAMMGLMDAATRFDPSRGIMFKTFAERRIRGAIYDEIRKMDWFSRSLREKQGRIGKTITQMEHRLGRTPEEEEVAAAMEMTLDEYRHMLGQVCHLGCVSLNETLDDRDDGRNFLDLLTDDSPSVQQRIEESELASELAGQLEKLSEKERLVISLYYYEELTQKEIAEVLDLTEGRISQLHSQALVKLKVKLSRPR